MKKLFRKETTQHIKNAQTPYILRRVAVFGMTLMVVVTFAISNLQSFVWVASDWMVSTILPSVIVTDTNKEREADNLVPLQRNTLLDVAATLKAQDMAEGQYFDHYSPDGVSPWHWFDTAGYDFVHAGENLAIYFTDSSEIVDAWMNSPAHRDNILNNNYREIGIGVARGEYDGHETVFVVQLFGTPAASQGARSVAVVQNEPDEVIREQRTNDSNGASASSVAGASESEEASEPVLHIAEDETVGLYLEHIATSTGGAPAIIENIKQNDLTGTERLWAIATQPSTMLQLTYMVLATMVFAALMVSLLIDVRRQQPKQIAYSMGLITIMFLLFHVHIAISSGVMIA
ncbi:MAG: CAP domain-containing protein, partial [Candidatus Paceibacterota bacterium]